MKIEASDYYYEDFWFTHEDMHAHKNKSNWWIPISEGNVEGIVLGGNIETLLTLAGTKFSQKWMMQYYSLKYLQTHLLKGCLVSLRS